MRRAEVLAILLTAIAVISLPATILAVSQGGALAFRFDPSVRAAGMGGAGNGVFWGQDANIWCNPALLGYHRGLRFEHTEMDLQEDIGIGSRFETDRVTIGAWGFGLSLAGKPFEGLGGLDLDYGPQLAVDESGNPIGSFNPKEEVDAWAIGLSLAEFGENVLRWLGRDAPSLSRYADLSLGYSAKTDAIFLAPNSVLQDNRGGSAEVDNKDRGLLLRVTPYNSMDYPGWSAKLDALFDRLGGLRVDVSHARAKQSYQDAAIVFVDAQQADPVAKISRSGWAVRFAIGMPVGVRTDLSNKGLGWLMDSLTPLLSWGKAWDRNRARGVVPNTGEEWEESTIRNSGWELTVANIYSIRRGHVTNPDGMIDGDTSGWSLGFRLLDVAGFRYDKATVPRADGREDFERDGYTFFVDALAIRQRLAGS